MGPSIARHDAVIVGLDPDVDYWSLAVAMSAVAGGARLIATNADARYPTPSGFLPGAGAILAALTTATGATPEVIGKPSPAMFAAILEASGIGADEAVVIGDNPDADVVGAHRAGLAAILVLTGVADAVERGRARGRASPGGDCGRSGRGAVAPGRPPQVMACPDHHASHARVAAAKMGCMTTGGANARRKPFSAIAVSSSAFSPTASAVANSSSVNVVSLTVRSSVDSVTLTPARWSAAIGWLARSATARDCTFEVGHRSSVTSRARRSWTRSGSSSAVTPWATRLTPRSSTSRTRVGTGHLAGVGGERESALLRRVECSGVRRGRPRGLGTGQVESDERRAELRRHPGELHVGARRMLAHGRRDEADERRGRTVRRRGAGDARRDRLDDGVHGQAAVEVESRCPADLRVSDAVRDQVLDQLGGHSLECLGGLEQRDRQVEEGEQLGLVGAPLGTDHAALRLLEGEWHADRRREIDRGRRPHGPVEVLVQLGLRERTQGIDGDHGAMIGTRAAISIDGDARRSGGPDRCARRGSGRRHRRRAAGA